MGFRTVLLNYGCGNILPSQLTSAHVLRCTRVERSITSAADTVGRKHCGGSFPSGLDCGSQALPRVSGIFSLCASESGSRCFDIPRLPSMGIFL